ncbi:MAG: hypothetical protein HQK76_18875 [Desulfobacterales bacterium]|nr:hypothetical protein [Desulfobacterales bacterium]
MILNLIDLSFAHDKFAVAGKKSKYIVWDRTCKNKTIPTFYTHEKIFEVKTPKELSYALIFKSKAIIPEVYKNIPSVIDKFTKIFTHDQDLLESYPDTCQFIPGGGIWIGGKHGLGKVGMFPKNKLISIVSSKKTMCPLHVFRLKLATDLLKNPKVHVFGLKEWIAIYKTLQEYMFSIVIENDISENYFTEKLLNCFAVGTIPIYIGCPNIENFFNPEGIIRINQGTNISELINKLSSKEYYAKGKAVRENMKIALQYESIEDFIYKSYFEKELNLTGSDINYNTDNIGKITEDTNDLREIYQLNRNNISKIDLTIFSKYLGNKIYSKFFFDKDFKEHYRIVAYLSSFFNNALIFDVGTYMGHSALALSYNKTNKIISYDIKQARELFYEKELDNIDFHIGNVLEDKRLLEAPLIIIDTNHDGIFEKEIYNFLKQNKYKGLLFLDDIHLNKEMVDFWKLISEPKIDITNLGHFSGSGLVDFGLRKTS